MMTDTIIARRFDRLEKKLDLLLTEKKDSGTWIKIPVLKSLTGWSTAEVRKYRTAGAVRWRKGKEGMQYNIDSIHK